MYITDEELKKLLIEPGYITENNFDALKKEAETQKKDLETSLIENGIIRDDELGKLTAESKALKFIDLRKEKINEDVLNMIPELVARTRGVIAFDLEKNGLKVAMTDPDDIEIKRFIEKSTGQKVLPYYATRRDLEESFFKYRSGIKEEFDMILKQLKAGDLSVEKHDEITVNVVDMLLQYGFQNKASDIHIEPYRNKVLIRFRIDGVMNDVLDIPKSLSDSIITRIKILSKLRTDVHRAAQDGKLRFNSKSDAIDVRVSIIPVTRGENVVMRILSVRNRQFSINDLGLTDDYMNKIKRAVKHPHGMILVTGPTGSGKTTTLYALLKILNKREIHIATIEDPVEYDIEGVSQIQVDPKTNLTFAKGLRAIVRQDPDVIMIGEIRDEETAGIAVNSAMTGHLVLSTLHTNDAATTLPRLIDMGIEPFIVASTVNIIIAQRLVRQICEKCRMSYTPTDAEKEMFEYEPHIKKFCELRGNDISDITLFKGKGCKFCSDTGYHGRIGIFEVLEVDDDIKKLILDRASSSQVTQEACKKGMVSMLDYGLEKVFLGETTLEEVLRVTSE